MTTKIIKDLGDGLILRHAVVEDTEALVEFNGHIHAEPGSDDPQVAVAAWVRDLMSRPHPTFDVGDFTIVEDTNTGKIVSSLNLINQTWSYDGVEFGVGRPELVGTDPEYRNHGLVRKQFEVIHEWSAARGHKVQGITGIPYFYRLFGYEMTVALDGSRSGYLQHVPKLKDGEEEKYTFRPATHADIPFISRVYYHANQRSLLSCKRDAEYWAYEISGKSVENINSAEVRVIEDLQGEAVGFLLHGRTIWSPLIHLSGYELDAGVSWLDVTPAVIRYLVKTGKTYAERKDDLELAGYDFSLGISHPAYEVFHGRLRQVNNPYAWYIRVADLPDFLRHISPVLERRLAESWVPGYSGDLRLSFYRSGVKLSFEQGKITIVESFRPASAEDGDVLFPELSFLRVLFGHSSYDEVEAMFADCFPRNDHGRALVKALFPQKDSTIWAIS